MSRLIVNCADQTIQEAAADEIAEVVPGEVTMRQARQALNAAGLLGAAEIALNSLPEPQRTAALIDWEYAATVRRDSPLVESIGPALALSEEDIDGLFIGAAAIL